jgi:hypothetical protein
MGFLGFGLTKQEKIVRKLLLKSQSEILSGLRDDDPLKGIVTFLGATAELQDNLELIEGVLIKKIDANGQNVLKVFKEFVKETGRNEKGLNRTKKGGMVYRNNVFLGTNPVSFWESNVVDGYLFARIKGEATNFMTKNSEISRTISKLLIYLGVKD